MNKNKILKLKKYLFLVSIIFFLLSSLHLGYIYMHSDSKLIPLKGGTVSEGIIGEIPKLNPLLPSFGNDKYIISLLYRSLMKYDIKNKKIDSDIASCDISNLKKIECYLENNIYWSNGKPITIKDIISTYKVFSKKDQEDRKEVNPIMSSLLSETEIVEKEGSIVFINKKEDINFLNIFFQPILAQEVIYDLGENDLFKGFSPIDGIYSGKYKISAINQGVEAGVSKIILEKNDKYTGNDQFIDKLIFKVYPETSVFLKHKDTVNLFSDKNNIVGNSVSRLKPYNYTLPQYVSLYLNVDRIGDKELRNYLLNIIHRGNLINILGNNNFKEIKNPYLTDVSIDKQLKNKNITKLIEKAGYRKKPLIIENFIKTSKNKIIYSREAFLKKTSSGKTSTGSNKVISTDLDFEKNLQKDSKIIFSPGYVDKYNFITKEVFLKGKVYENVEEVYINDKPLVLFKPGDKEFSYKLSTTNGNLKTGENYYKIYFIKDREKIFIEEISFLYYKDKKKLNEKKSLFINDIVERRQASILEEKESKDNKLLESKKSEIKVMEEDPVYKAKLDRLRNLEDHFYYDENLNKLTFKLFYINSEKNLSETAEYIQKIFIDAGIDVELYPISLKSLPKILTEENQRYDMLLIGVNLGYFDSNIFPYFHSSQVQKGYNFSNFKKLSLDLLLEELRSSILNKNKILELEGKVLDILKQEQIIKVLYTPIINNLVDKNIKNYFLEDYIPNTELRIQALNNSFILEKNIVKTKNKSIYSFLKFLITGLND